MRREYSTQWLRMIVIALVAGCGGSDRPSMGYVSGTVKIDGAPVENLLVQMKPQEGRAAYGKTDSKGYYNIEYTKGEKGTKVGPTTVSFDWPMGFSGPKSIPQKYSAAKSENKIEVKPGNNTFDFNLESEKEGTSPKKSATPD